MMELYLLEQLIAFSRQGTLSGAAEKLHISQPALSQSMKKLEESLGVSLFERSKNKIAPVSYTHLMPAACWKNIR